MNTQARVSPPELDFDTPALRRHRRVRALKDRLAEWVVGIGGISVIVAVLLIFFYLLYEVAPLFEGASMEPWQQNEQPLPAYQLSELKGKPLYLTLEEQAEVALQVTDQGELAFFSSQTGQLLSQQQLNLPAGVNITSFALQSESSHQFALGFSNGQALVIKHEYKITYPNNKRLITPRIEFPYGETPIQVLSDGQAIEYLAVRDEDRALALVASHGQQLELVRYSKDTNFITEEVELTRNAYKLPQSNRALRGIEILPGQQWVLVGESNGSLSLFDIRNLEQPLLAEQLNVSKGEITELELLLGGQSLLIGDTLGTVSQWFLVRDDKGDWHLQRIRDFKRDGHKVVTIATEHRRKGFAVAYEDGLVSFYNTTAETNVLNEQLFEAGAAKLIAFGPRGNALLSQNQQGQLQLWSVYNKHPEVSLKSLWGKVWYEGYEDPQYVWQSSSASNDFEPKYSLMPLTFGTLKAAFYAMLLAMPLAICGAIYTAYFMAPSLRRKIKPFIELMEALPTVILGFFAGLFLAPFVETNLTFIFMALLLVPVGILAFAFAWAQMPSAIRHRLPEGFDALLLIPVILLLIFAILGVTEPVENSFFGGDMRTFITNELGINFDQRNALVVGLAMGFAVIPTIFSITEDAIFGVPKSLTYGSLALGATPWQTLVRVVMPTASPGIFSAVMIGLGRAVGETMIVLMATGNTPIMDVNIFEGMRTLAANIAVEMPESEVGSSHYRILFLAALVLFGFTFVMNTAAEIIRQRLRKKYGSL
ncbi:ABC transporter permease subunit [Balneatrix alpica]|uniref:ABC transporter permease subunit n=1 Tax=Balneatrix alpica TaxID=75684 RepID=A0ABV5ZFI5_9GAMM|nr:ABC transporter permease subunit [Balneatrix alpica]